MSYPKPSAILNVSDEFLNFALDKIERYIKSNKNKTIEFRNFICVNDFCNDYGIDYEIMKYAIFGYNLNYPSWPYISSYYRRENISDIKTRINNRFNGILKKNNITTNYLLFFTTEKFKTYMSINIHKSEMINNDKNKKIEDLNKRVNDLTSENKTLSFDIMRLKEDNVALSKKTEEYEDIIKRIYRMFPPVFAFLPPLSFLPLAPNQNNSVQNTSNTNEEYTVHPGYPVSTIPSSEEVKQ
jgi:hypothetical protein